MANRNEKIKEILRDMGAKFLLLNGNTSSLLTVTRVELTNDEKRATIFFTVFPKSTLGGSGDRDEFTRFSQEQMEKTALEFAKRKRAEFKEFVKDNSKLGRIPLLDFEIDTGEKNRQRIDSLLNQ